MEKILKNHFLFILSSVLMSLFFLDDYFAIEFLLSPTIWQRTSINHVLIIFKFKNILFYLSSSFALAFNLKSAI